MGGDSIFQNFNAYIDIFVLNIQQSFSLLKKNGCKHNAFKIIQGKRAYLDFIQNFNKNKLQQIKDFLMHLQYVTVKRTIIKQRLNI